MTSCPEGPGIILLASSEALIYLIGDLRVDLTQARILRNDEEIPLNPKAFRVLVHLLKERNRLVSKEELLALYWPDTAVSDEALTQCIARLRRALGDDPRNPTFLKTVPRMGYRFVGPVEEIAAVEAAPASGPAVGAETPPVVVSRRVAVPPIRWLLAGALTVGLLAAAGLWSGFPRRISFPGVRGIGVSSAETEWWETAWWKLNEGTGLKTTDSMHGLTAALPAGVSWTSGISGPGLQFAGRELVVRGDDPGVLPNGDAPRTFTAWIKARTTNADSTAIFGAGDPQRDSTANFTLALHESGTAAFNAGHFMMVGKTRVDDGAWHQVTGVYEGRESRRMRLFVDGAEQASAMAPALSPGKQSQWTIGTGFSGGTTFRGAVDDIRVYERALRPDEIRSLYRCLANAGDIEMPDRGSYQFVPLYGDSVEVLPRRPGDNSAGVRNAGTDYAGVTIVRRESDCGLRSIHGADMGQDLNIEAKLLVPVGAGGVVADAGLYFRSRRANPGDGIVGGTSAGFCVRLDSTGQVRVQRLHPNAMLAFSNAPERFDPKVFHHLEAAVHGETLEVALDGTVVTFDADGIRRTALRIPPAWQSASPKGNNGGSTGIVFSCSKNRGKAGGQEARDIRVTACRPLHGG